MLPELVELKFQTTSPIRVGSAASFSYTIAEMERVPVWPSRSFDKVFNNHLSHLQDAILACIQRIAANPYEPMIVLNCQPNPEADTFRYYSPIGFELYWDVHTKPALSLRADERDTTIWLLDLMQLEHTTNFWLEPLHY